MRSPISATSSPIRSTTARQPRRGGSAARSRSAARGPARGCRREAIQNEVYEVGKAHYGKEALRDWFKVLYETLLGTAQGPRMGSFFALYGPDNSRKLIAEALARSA
jgi:hypothetical protein